MLFALSGVIVSTMVVAATRLLLILCHVMFSYASIRQRMLAVDWRAGYG